MDVEVKPGHYIFFKQPILHCVLKTKAKTDSYRQFAAFRITSESTNKNRQPMFNVLDAISRQAVPPLPSGQIPPMFSLHHNSALLYKATIPWSDQRVRDELKEDRFLTRGTVRMCPRVVKKGLVELGWDYEEYDREEVAIMLPRRPMEWKP